MVAGGHSAVWILADVELKEFLREICGFLLESTPERRRRRYGDVEYDWDYRVDTTSATIRLRDRLLGVFHSLYQFLDLGSGKGPTLLMASDYPFRRIVGVELLPELHRVAEENVCKYQTEQQKCFRIEAICADAREFVLPKEPAVIYLFNPFPERALKNLTAKLERSLQEGARPVHVLYHNPLQEHVLAHSTLLRKAGGTHQYVVYTHRDCLRQRRRYISSWQIRIHTSAQAGRPAVRLNQRISPQC